MIDKSCARSTVGHVFSIGETDGTVLYGCCLGVVIYPSASTGLLDCHFPSLQAKPKRGSADYEHLFTQLRKAAAHVADTTGRKGKSTGGMSIPVSALANFRKSPGLRGQLTIHTPDSNSTTLALSLVQEISER